MSNGREVEKLFLHQDNIHLTIRLVAEGGFDTSEPELTSRIAKIRSTCPILLDGFLPTAKQASDSEEAEMAIQADPNHSKPMVAKCISRSFAKDVLDLPTSTADLKNVSHPICLAVRQAYTRDYHRANIVNLSTAGFQWCEQFSFTDEWVISNNCSTLKKIY